MGLINGSILVLLLLWVLMVYSHYVCGIVYMQIVRIPVSYAYITSPNPSPPTLNPSAGASPDTSVLSTEPTRATSPTTPPTWLQRRFKQFKRHNSPRELVS
jgi:hypothetical protein